MKVPIETKNTDLLCHESMSILSERILKIFTHHFPDHKVWFPDDTSNWCKNLNYEKSTHIVLYGNFLRSLIEIPLWPIQNIYLWVLSERTKEIILKLTKLPRDHVGVIPRSMLQKRSPLRIKTTKNLFYAGRISRQKNIVELLLTTYFLQKEHTQEYTLSLYGDFDNEYNQNHGRFSFRNTFEKEINEIIKLLEWTNCPALLGHFDKYDWPNQIKKPSTFLSLSTFFMEDFGVSIAQSLESGHKCLTSDWGGFSDSLDSNHDKFASWLVPSPEDLLGFKFAMCREIAIRITNSHFILDNNHKTDELVLPQIITKSRLSEVHQIVLKTLGPSSILIPRDQLASFADTLEGKRAIDSFHEFLHGSTKPRLKSFLIVSQFGHETVQEHRDIFHLVPKLISSNEASLSTMDCIRAMSKFGLEKLFVAHSIHITHTAIDKFPKIISFFNDLNIPINIIDKGDKIPYSLERILGVE